MASTNLFEETNFKSLGQSLKCLFLKQHIRAWKTAYTHAPVCVHTMYAKALEGTQKNVHANFEYLFISKILEKDFTEIFCHCFIETSFVVHF